jgi:hypothetical protein
MAVSSRSGRLDGEGRREHLFGRLVGVERAAVKRRVAAPSGRGCASENPKGFSEISARRGDEQANLARLRSCSPRRGWDSAGAGGLGVRAGWGRRVPKWLRGGRRGDCEASPRRRAGVASVPSAARSRAVALPPSAQFGSRTAKCESSAAVTGPARARVTAADEPRRGRRLRQASRQRRSRARNCAGESAPAAWSSPRLARSRSIVIPGARKLARRRAAPDQRRRGKEPFRCQ